MPGVSDNSVKESSHFYYAKTSFQAPLFNTLRDVERFCFCVFSGSSPDRSCCSSQGVLLTTSFSLPLTCMLFGVYPSVHLSIYLASCTYIEKHVRASAPPCQLVYLHYLHSDVRLEIDISNTKDDCSQRSNPTCLFCFMGLCTQR